MNKQQQHIAHRANYALATAGALYRRARTVIEYIRSNSLEASDIRAMLEFQDSLLGQAEESHKRAMSLLTNLISAGPQEPEDLPS